MSEQNVAKTVIPRCNSGIFYWQVVLAKEAGLCYAAVAMATDYDSWRDKGEKVNVASVLKIFRENVEKITTLFTAVIPKIHDANWTEEIKEAKVSVSFFLFFSGISLIIIASQEKL